MSNENRARISTGIMSGMGAFLGAGLGFVVGGFAAPKNQGRSMAYGIMTLSTITGAVVGAAVGGVASVSMAEKILAAPEPGAPETPAKANLVNQVAARFGRETAYKGRVIRPSSPSPSGEPWMAWFADPAARPGEKDVFYFNGPSEEDVTLKAVRVIDTLQAYV